MSVPAGAGIAGNQSQSLAALELLANPGDPGAFGVVE